MTSRRLGLLVENYRTRFDLWRERAEHRFSVAWAIQSGIEDDKVGDLLRQLFAELWCEGVGT